MKFLKLLYSSMSIFTAMEWKLECVGFCICSCLYQFSCVRGEGVGKKRAYTCRELLQTCWWLPGDSWVLGCIFCITSLKASLAITNHYSHDLLSVRMLPQDCKRGIFFFFWKNYLRILKESQEQQQRSAEMGALRAVCTKYVKIITAQILCKGCGVTEHRSV